MTTLADTGYPNLTELAARLDPQGNGISHITNVLSKEKPMLEHIPWFEGNLQTGHQVSRTVNSLSTATWRKVNQGVAATKNQVGNYTEACGRLEDFSYLDQMMSELNGGPEFRLSEDKIKMEAMAQQFVSAILYSDVTANPEQIHGFMPRFPASSGFDSSDQVVVGTNSGSDAHSILLCTWEERKVYGIYPKGTRAGLEVNDLGMQILTPSASSTSILRALVTQLIWRCGLCIEDMRYVVRGQWDPGDADMATSERGLILLFQSMVHKLYKVTANTRAYMNRTTVERLNAQLISNENSPLKYVWDNGGLVGDTNTGGARRVPELFGIPIYVEDSLVAEDAIS
jgi:hypothetical protein